MIDLQVICIITHSLQGLTLRFNMFNGLTTEEHTLYIYIDLYIIFLCLWPWAWHGHGVPGQLGP